MRYLKAPVSIFGNNAGPLCLETRGKEQQCLFALNKPLTKPFYRLLADENINISPEQWLDSQESFLIRCTGRVGRIDGFVALARQNATGQKEYQMICRQNPEGHDSTDLYMTFALKKPDSKPDSTDNAETCL